MKAQVLALATVAAFGACKSERRAAPAHGLADLGGSLDALRSEFNAHQHEARFLTLLSPT